MTKNLSAPFFEIGPKNLLRRPQLELLARAAGDAANDFDVTVVLTVPTALVAPIAELRTGVLVFAQTMSAECQGPSMGAVTAESLIDAGADGVMLNHDSNPMDADTLRLAVSRARQFDLSTIVCAGSEEESVDAATLSPGAVLFEPPALIGTIGGTTRPWIAESNRAVRAMHPEVLMMHAGGVSRPDIARAIMVAGADGTGSTSGILSSDRPISIVRDFIAATRAGWDAAHQEPTDPLTIHHHEEQK